jgi:AmmeMemoRadiSam system protein B/AmmeMemoRadiSam system protein A
MLAGLVDKKAKKEDVIGVVSPHAGYVYSGPVTGATLSRVRFKETFIIMGPNHTGLGRPFSIMTRGAWATPLGEVPIDAELGRQILAASRYLQEDSQAHRFEHSIEVQLPFLQYLGKNFKLVPIVLAGAPEAVYKEIGRAIATAVRDLKREVVIIASSDMTHYEPQQSAKQKDDYAIEALLRLDEDELVRRIQERNITMCGYAPAVCLITAARGLGAGQAELVSYRTSGDASGDYSSVVGYAGILIKKRRLPPPVSLAKEAVEKYIRKGIIITPPAKLNAAMQKRAGVFVSLHKLGQLRGCIGTFEPTQQNVAMEIIANAISSATRDPRFPPVTAGELDDLDYSVDVLTGPKPVKDADKLDPSKYGLIVECGYKKGLLLPDLEGVDSVEQQIDICRQKAGILPHEPVDLYSFEVKRYK